MPPQCIQFNRDVAIDLVWLDHAPVLHVVDLQTRFQTAAFLQSKTSEAIWQVFVDIWATTYAGFPTTIHCDQETSFVSSTFSGNCEQLGVTLAVSGIESHNSIRAGESYHRQLPRVFHCIRSAHPAIEPPHALRLAVKAVNDTAGVDGLAPSELVFGVRPAFPVAPRSNPKQQERFNALQAARDEMAQIIVERRINDALRRKLPPSTKYLIRPGDKVRVYREKNKAWDGPFSVTKTDRKLISVTDGIKTKTFNAALILPHQSSVLDAATKRHLERVFDNAIYSVDVLKSTDPRFHSTASREAIRKEILGLESRGVFKIVDKSKILDGAIILGSKFILAIKDAATPNERYKARFVVLGHTDPEKVLLIHAAVPVRMRSVRLLFSTGLMFGWEVWLEDMDQAYCQGSPLKRAVYVKADPLFGYPPNTYLLLILPLYGLRESGDAWHNQLTSFLKSKVKATPTTTDRSLYTYKPANTRTLQDIIAIYVDDCIYSGSAEFIEHSKMIAERFDSKPRKPPPFKFAGISVERPNRYEVEMNQLAYIDKLQPLSQTANFTSFRTLRHQIAWVSNTRPDVLAGVNIMSQVTERSFKPKHVERINSLVQQLKSNDDIRSRHVTLDRASLHLVVFTDGSFATNEDLSSQTGYIVFLTDKSRKANLLHCASSKSKRIVRSVLGSETIGLTTAADMAISIAHDASDMLEEKIPITILTDSETLFSVLIKSTTTTELRLMIDIAATKESFDRLEISTISWIRRLQNLADAMTKFGINKPFMQYLRSNKLEFDIDQSVLRAPIDKLSDKRRPLSESTNPIRDNETYLTTEAGHVTEPDELSAEQVPRQEKLASVKL